jgi:hypothetical protein
MLRCICKRVILEPGLIVDDALVQEEFQRLVDDYKFAFDKPLLWHKLSVMCKATDSQVIMTDDALPELLYKMIVIEYLDKKLWFELHPAARALYRQHSALIDNTSRP